MTRPRLTSTAREALLARLPAWSHDPVRDALVRAWDFPDFDAAWAFLQDVAALAREQDHHPDWRNVYGRVEIALWTHDAGGLTAADARLAEAIESLPSAAQPGRGG